MIGFNKLGQLLFSNDVSSRGDEIAAATRRDLKLWRQLIFVCRVVGLHPDKDQGTVRH